MKDTGCDPILGGMFRMYPSGDIVDWEERVRRLPIIEIDRTKEDAFPPCIGGVNEMQVNIMQGGKMDIFLDITEYVNNGSIELTLEYVVHKSR